MNELVTVAQWGPFTITAYGLCVLLAVLAGTAVTVLRARKTAGADKALTACLIVIPCALLGARLLYCLATWGNFVNDYEEQGGVLYMLQLWEGGYTLYGGILGGLLALALYARGAGLRTAELADAFAPGAALALVFLRGGEYFTMQGTGLDMENESLWFFPLAAESQYGWRLPVFFYEALAALIILIVLLCLKERRNGFHARMFLGLLAVTQILLENLRQDEFIMIPIVRAYMRLNMLMGAFVCAALLVMSLVRIARRQGGLGRREILRIIVTAAAVGIVIGLEFAFDKSEISVEILYLIMACALAGLGWAALADDGKAYPIPN